MDKYTAAKVFKHCDRLSALCKARYQVKQAGYMRGRPREWGIELALVGPCLNLKSSRCVWAFRSRGSTIARALANWLLSLSSEIRIGTCWALSRQGFKMSTKVTNKSVYDLAKKELKNRSEIKLDSGLKVPGTIGSKQHSVSIPLHLLLIISVSWLTTDWMQFQRPK